MVRQVPSQRLNVTTGLKFEIGKVQLDTLSQPGKARSIFLIVSRQKAPQEQKKLEKNTVENYRVAFR